MPFLQYSRLLLGSIIIAILGIGGMVFVGPETDMHILPESGIYYVGESFAVNIVVESKVPVNVFKGELFFDTDVMYVESISYNTSIADLWAKEPWYSNGNGTLNFIGGTTRKGGFIGTGELVTITFTTTAPGDATVHMDNIRILEHDGLGSEAVTAAPIDTIFTIQENVDASTVLQKDGLRSSLQVVKEESPTDLNGDGMQTLADMSIFLGHFATQDLKGDVNDDGKINMTDMSIMLDAK